MKQIGAILIMLLVAASASANMRVEFVPGEIIVKFKPAVIEAEPEVEYAQPNYIYRTMAVPNDPLASQQWAVQNTGQTIVTPATGFTAPDSVANPGTLSADMNLTQAWDIHHDCGSIIVAVLDTGINYNHEDLSANMWTGGPSCTPECRASCTGINGDNCVDNTKTPMDDNGHGTHVAGIIGAVGNNNKGTTGICWSTQLMAVKVMDNTGAGTTANIVKGIDFAIANSANVINMSLGYYTYDATLYTALSNANSAGIAVVAAAGNDTNDNDSTPFYPCDYGLPNIVCVAALDQTFNLATFSNYGQSSVTLGAPGVNIVSTWAGTETVATDQLTGGWIPAQTGNWSYEPLSAYQNGSLVSLNALVDPPNYDGVAALYNLSADDQAYKYFAGAAGASVLLQLQYFMFLNTPDLMNISYVVGKANPFVQYGGPWVAGGAVQLDSVTGSSSSNAVNATYDITPQCTDTPWCSIGFALESGTGPASFGVAIISFKIDSLDNTVTNAYNLEEGTSMAAPQVAGIIALVMAANPNYTAQQAINAVVYGGVPNANLTQVTTSGNSANALGALTYISPPTGLVIKQN